MTRLRAIARDGVTVLLTVEEHRPGWRTVGGEPALVEWFLRQVEHGLTELEVLFGGEGGAAELVVIRPGDPDFLCQVARSLAAQTGYTVGVERA